MDRSLKLLWVAGKPPPNHKWQQQALYNSSIRHAIVHCGVDFEELNEHSRTQDLIQGLAHTTNSVCGLLLVRPLDEVGPISVLSSAAREQHDFFRLVDAGPNEDEHIMLLKVVERCVFERPVHIGPEGLVTNPHGRWVTLTEWTHQRCMETACTTGDLVHTIADLWSVHWPVADAPARLCMFLQAPHLALILSVSQWGWGTLAFQYAQGRRGRGLRCHLAKPLLDGYIDVAALPPQQGPAAHAPAVMSPDLLLNVADTLRSLVQPREAGQLIPQIHIDSARAHAL